MKRKLLVSAMLVDTVGSGLLGAFELLFGHVVVGLPLGAAGLSLTVGSAFAIAAGPLAGSFVDRVGGTSVTMAANATSAAGCALLLVAPNALLFGVAAFLLAAGSRMFWAAFPLLVASIVGEGDRRAWFGKIRSVRYAGITGGQALAGAVLLLGQREGLRGLAIGDCASYIAAIALVALAARNADPTAAPERSTTGGYRAALRHRANVGLAALNVVATLIVTAPLLAMPVLVIQQLRFAAWLPGLIAALNTAAIAIAAFFIGRLLGSRSNLRVLAFAASLWAVGCALYAVASDGGTVAYALLALGIVVLGLGEAAYAPTADAVPLELAPPDQAGRYTAMHQLAWGISGAIAPSLAALLLTHGRATLWIVLALVSAALSLAYALAGRALSGADTSASPLST
jgi:MFS family permease